MEAKGQCWVCPSITVHLLFEIGFSLNLELTDCLELLVRDHKEYSVFVP